MPVLLEVFPERHAGEVAAGPGVLHVFHPQYQTTTVGPGEKLGASTLERLRADAGQTLAIDTERCCYRRQLAQSSKGQ